jgi:hypothetical protein
LISQQFLPAREGFFSSGEAFFDLALAPPLALLSAVLEIGASPFSGEACSDSALAPLSLLSSVAGLTTLPRFPFTGCSSVVCALLFLDSILNGSVANRLRGEILHLLNTLRLIGCGMDKKEPTGSTATNKTAGNADCTIRARPNGLPSTASLFFYVSTGPSSSPTYLSFPKSLFLSSI